MEVTMRYALIALALLTSPAAANSPCPQLEWQYGLDEARWVSGGTILDVRRSSEGALPYMVTENGQIVGYAIDFSSAQAIAQSWACAKSETGDQPQPHQENQMQVNPAPWLSPMRGNQ